jgi:CHAT domain-containing protein
MSKTTTFFLLFVILLTLVSCVPVNNQIKNDTIKVAQSPTISQSGNCESNACLIKTFYENGLYQFHKTNQMDYLISLCTAFINEKKYFEVDKCTSHIKTLAKKQREEFKSNKRKAWQPVDLFNQKGDLPAYEKDFLKQLIIADMINAKKLFDYNKFYDSLNAYYQLEKKIRKTDLISALNLEYISILKYGGMSAAYVDEVLKFEHFANKLRQISYGGGIFSSSTNKFIVNLALADLFFAQGMPKAAGSWLYAKVEGMPSIFSVILAGVSIATIGQGPGSIAFLDTLNALNQLSSIENTTLSTPDELKIPTLYKKARMLYEFDQAKQSKTIYEQLLAIKELSSHNSIHYMVLHDLSKLESDTNKSINYLKQSISVLEQFRSNINTDIGKIAFMSDKQSVYADLIRLLVKHKRYAEAFEFAERAKSRAFVDMLASKNKFGHSSSNSTKLINQTTKIEESIVNNIKSSDVKNRGLIIKSSQQIAKADPELASLISVQPVSFKKIQKSLATKEVLLEYYGFKNELYAFLVTKKSIKVYLLPVKNLERLVKRYRSAIKTLNPKKEKNISQQLYAQLIKPLEKDIRYKNITLIPHGPMHYLPFYALYNGKHYLIDNFQIRTLPSSSIISFLKKQKKTSPNMLVLGNPDLEKSTYNLPGAENEAKLISKSEKNTKLLLRKTASETAFKKQAPKYSVIHYAGHAKFDFKKPMSSALLLSKDKQNNGRLTLNEVYDLKLNADLVTLSACETSMGKVSSGDEVIGLNRGFLYSGAKAIISSLWQVSDLETGKMMVHLYKNRKKHDNSEALRLAQLYVKNKISDKPFHWASFQYIGAQ